MRLVAPILATISLCLPAAAQPEPSAPTVESAADHSTGRVAPGEIVRLRPANAGPPVLLGAQLDSHGIVTTMLSDTRVWFDGFAAPLAYSALGDVMAVVPYEIWGRTKTEAVVEYQGKRSPPVTLDVVESAPALFTLDASGKGQAAMLNETGCCNSVRNPATRGTVATLWATGEGWSSHPPAPGGFLAFTRKLLGFGRPDLPAATPVKVTVGGMPAEI